MIVITGATGQLGGQVVQQLLQRVPAEQVAVSVREPAAAQHLADQGVRVRRGDFGDPGSLDAAFEGATQVLVVSVNSLGAEAVAQHRAAFDAARRAGAQRILYTSHQAAGADSRFVPARDHAATEAHLASTGVAWTTLRDGFHAATVPHLLGRALETGELVAPADGPVSWTTHADLAAGAAAILTDPARPEKDTAVLTATEALDLEGVAGLLSELTGRPVRRVVVSDEDYLSGMTGVPEATARMLLSMFQAARAGEFDVTDPALTTLLGRPTQPLRDVLAAALPTGASRH